MTSIDVQEISEHFLALVKQLENGEEVIIHKDNVPFAKLSPIMHTKGSRKFGSAKSLIQIADDFDEPLDDFAEYR